MMQLLPTLKHVGIKSRAQTEWQPPNASVFVLSAGIILLYLV